MLGLLISQPNSSQHNHPPPPPSITHHHNRNDDGGDDGDDDGSDGDGSLKVCKDCGNRAKKECSFRRCRTCCKTRGFDCATHERSTWIPASKRRDKRIGSGSGSFSSYGGVKRPRTFVPSPSSHINVTDSSSSANDFSLGLSSYTQDSRFKKCLPRRIEARAVFRNIRVTDVSDGEAENAYVATVNISGHVFRGLLYDHGNGTHRDHNNNNNNNNNNNVFPCVTKLHMETSTSGRGRRNRDSSSTIVDPSNTNTLTAASSGN